MVVSVAHTPTPHARSRAPSPSHRRMRNSTTEAGKIGPTQVPPPPHLENEAAAALVAPPPRHTTPGNSPGRAPLLEKANTRQEHTRALHRRAATGAGKIMCNRRSAKVAEPVHLSPAPSSRVRLESHMVLWKNLHAASSLRHMMGVERKDVMQCGAGRKPLGSHVRARGPR